MLFACIYYISTYKKKILNFKFFYHYKKKGTFLKIDFGFYELSYFIKANGSGTNIPSA